MPIGPPVPANIPIVPWAEENLSPNSKSIKISKISTKIIGDEIHVNGKMKCDGSTLVIGSYYMV